MPKHDSNRHHRRSIRLKDYDYRQSGWYFVTICTQIQECVFGYIIENQVELNVLGCVVDTCWNEIPAHFSHVRLDTYIIMPNHVHGILGVTEDVGAMSDVGARHVVPLQQNPASSESFGKPVSGSLATVIRSFKAATTRQINTIRETTGEKLWQRNYYESVIHAETDLHAVRHYIETNPERWSKHPAK